MTVRMTCKHCRTLITADNEEELVAQVQTHTRDHDGERALSREHILARLDRLQRQHAQQD